MTELNEPIFYITLTIMLNWVISYCIYKLVNNLSINKSFQLWVKAGVEDGDDQLNLKDISAIILVFFGFLFLWLLLNIILGSLIFSNDKLTLIFSVGSIAGSLLGVGNILKK